MKISEAVFPSTFFVYTALTGVSKIQRAVPRLQAWAKSALPELPTQYVLRFLDSFRDAPPEKVRMQFGIFLPNMMESLPSGIEGAWMEETPVLTASGWLTKEDFSQAWQQLHAYRLNLNIHLSERPPFEIHHNDPEKHSEKLHQVTLVLPIRK